MRNMSFSLTTRQVRDRTKTVTRRLGWENLEPGERVQAIVKGQGIPKGGKVEKICVIECVRNGRERLCMVTLDDVRREGFGCSVNDFVSMFCTHNACGPLDFVSRIEFTYVEDEHV